jgi:imidazolonepropionase-like amidohydrolase
MGRTLPRTAGRIPCGAGDRLPARPGRPRPDRLVTPTFAFGGWRADEFELRLLGRSYQEIMTRGGGIVATVAETRNLPFEVLGERCLGFLAGMASLGVTTVECKSGYGLDEARPNCKSTRSVSPGSRDGSSTPWTWCRPSSARTWCRRSSATGARRYVDAACANVLIPRAARSAGLARFCDVFVEDRRLHGRGSPARVPGAARQPRPRAQSARGPA